MKKITFWLHQSLFFVLAISVFACTKTETKDSVIKEEFCLTDTLAKNIEFAKAEVKPVANELVLQGKITFDEDKVAKVYPLTGGFVKELRVSLGDFVQNGQVLAVIRSPDIANFANESSVAQANLTVAEKNYNIAQELYKTGSNSELELIQAKKELETAKAEVFRSKEVMSMYNVGKESYYNILAPASGFIVAKDIALNMELRTEDVKPIFTISNPENVWVMANIYESDISKVKEGYEVDITTISYANQVFKGKVDKVFSMIDPESKVLKAKIVLQNPDYKLKPEMFANVTVKYEDGEKKMCVPSKAVIFDKNKYFVMIYKDRCKIETREIQIYKAMTTNTYILSGLQEGEQIITKYQLLIYDALND